MDIPFALKSYKSSSLPLSAERVVNMYPEVQPRNAKSQVALFGCPGIETQVTLGTGPIRGLHVVDGLLYVVSGGTLYCVEEDLTITPHGSTISGSGVVSMADNGTELVIVNGTTGYIHDPTSGFRVISDTEFNAADTVGFIDSFFLFNNKGTGQAFRSDQLDGTSYDGTAFATAESNSDDLLAVYPYRDILYLPGKETIELWSNSGAANFPFQVLRGATIQRGIAGSFGITDEDESLFILGDDRIAYRIAGRSPRRVSNHAIETAWQNYNTVANVDMFSYTWNGHKFVFFNFPQISATWCYDIATKMWHERVSHDRLGNNLGRWRGNCSVRAYEKVWVGDAFSGKLGTLSNTTYTEFGDNTVADMISPPIHMKGKRVFMPEFNLDIETGVGLTSGQGSDPQAVLSISDDGGHTFSTPEIWEAMGKKGQYDKTTHQLRWQRLGNFFQRNMRITISDPVRRAVYGARAPGLYTGI